MSEIPLNARAAAAVLMDEAGNDVERARALARSRLSSPEFEALRTLLWHTAIDTEIDQLWRSSRDIVKRETERGVTTFLARETPRPQVRPMPLVKGKTSTPSPAMVAAVQRSVGRWLAFAMPNGTKLEDWTKRELREHGHRVVASGRATVKTGAFFLSVVEWLPKEDSRVGDVLAEADLERLWRKPMSLPA